MTCVTGTTLEHLVKSMPDGVVVVLRRESQKDVEEQQILNVLDLHHSLLSGSMSVPQKSKTVKPTH